jgi:sugar phosphate isomerase/epimerase
MFKNLDPSALGAAGHQSEILELALTYGFRGIDLNMAEFAGRVKLHGMGYARRLLTSARVRVGTFSLPVDWDADDEAFRRQLSTLPEYVEIAKELGCTRALCAIAPAGDQRPYHENFELHKRRFAEICRVLEPGGVRLGVGVRAVEGLRKERAFQFIHDLDALLLLLNMVGAPNLGILVDVWDLWLAGSSLENVRALSAQQVVALQLADLPADVPPADVTEAQRLLPGATGRIDCAGVLAALAEMGYDGPVTIKADRTAFGNTRRDRAVKQAGDILDKLWKAAGLTPEGKLAVAAGR